MIGKNPPPSLGDVFLGDATHHNNLHTSLELTTIFSASMAGPDDSSPFGTLLLFLRGKLEISFQGVYLSQSSGSS